MTYGAHGVGKSKKIKKLCKKLGYKVRKVKLKKLEKGDFSGLPFIDEYTHSPDPDLVAALFGLILSKKG